MRDYWIKTRGKVTGPLRKSHLERMVREPITDFHAASQVMYQGLNNWTQAIYVEDLKDLFNETVLATKADPDPVGGNAYYTGWWGEMKSAMKRGQIVILVCMVAGGLIGRFFSDPALYGILTTDPHYGTLSVLKETMTTLSIIGFVSFIYEFVLRRSFHREMILNILNILEARDGHISRLKKSGIVDTYEKFDNGQISNKIGHLWNTTIRILKIYYTGLEDSIDELESAITQRGCKVEIIMLSPQSAEAILKRAKSRKVDPVLIEHSLKVHDLLVRDLYERTKDKFPGKLEYYQHEQFISVSLMGFEDTWIMGFYLHSKQSTSTSQIKVRGTDGFLTQDLYQHFEDQKAQSVQICPPPASHRGPVGPTVPVAVNYPVAQASSMVRSADDAATTSAKNGGDGSHAGAPEKADIQGPDPKGNN